MEMPKPGPAQEKLRAFIGEWRGKETMHPTQWMPEGGMRDAKISNRLALGGFAIIQDYEQFADGETLFCGHAVIIKNPHGDFFQMHWFDMFSPSLFEGAFDGETGSFVSSSAMGQTRASFDFSRRDAYSFKMEMSKDGSEWSPMMDGAYKRAG